MQHRINGGLTIKLDGAPEQIVRPGNPVAQIAIMGADYPGLRPNLVVAEGDRVAAGAPLFHDRKRPEIQVVAPVAGVVDGLVLGPRRSLSEITLTCRGDKSRDFAPAAPDTRAAVQACLLESGLWTALRERPFGRIPDPGGVPDALFISAMDSAPLAGEPAVVIDAAKPQFAVAVTQLARLCDGPVFVCQGPGAALVRDSGSVRVALFQGAHPAGLVGTHIDRLFPVTGNRLVWHIGYQDVLAFGALLETGHLPGTRVVALAGPGVEKPRLLQAPIGARIDDLVAGELRPGSWRVVSGPPLSGSDSGYLHRDHLQISVLERPMAHDKNRRAWWSGWTAPPKPPAMIPTRALDLALGPRLPALPLIRALCSGDAESADKLGCRGLLEEDVALLSYAAGGAADLGAALRNTLNRLEQSA